MDLGAGAEAASLCGNLAHPCTAPARVEKGSMPFLAMSVVRASHYSSEQRKKNI